MAKPFVKWPGGKSGLAATICAHMPGLTENYFEPFLGSGAVFFALEDRILRGAYLSDANPDLMITYGVVQSQTNELIHRLAGHAQAHCREHYYAVRQAKLLDPVDIAARFIYLNKTCFNGLYRLNKKGEFNAAMGSYKNPKICDEQNLRDVALVLQSKAHLLGQHSFRSPFIQPGWMDVVYCDPPYDGTYQRYTKEGFGPQDQEALRDRCLEWMGNGACVFVTSSDTPRIRSLYSPEQFEYVTVMAPRKINSDTKGRKAQSDLLLIGKKED